MSYKLKNKRKAWFDNLFFLLVYFVGYTGKEGARPLHKTSNTIYKQVFDKIYRARFGFARNQIFFFTFAAPDKSAENRNI
jgi:hypothetical protein